MILHIHDDDDAIDGFMLMNMMHTDRGELTLHVRRESGYDIVTLGPTGTTSQIMGCDTCGCR